MSSCIKHFSTTAGFLENCEIHFSPGLNCVIGARGTCKSTVVESIRYLFDHGDDRVRSLVATDQERRQPFGGLIRTTLGPGSIRCGVIVDTEGDVVQSVLEREVEGDTRIYQDGIREHTDRTLLSKIEIYSQGDLQRIAEDRTDTLRIELIDRPNSQEIAALLRQRQAHVDELETLGPRLREIRAEVLRLQAEVEPIPALAEELGRVEADCPELTPELESERAQYEKRQRVISILEALEVRRADTIRHLRELEPKLEQVSAFARELEQLASDVATDSFRSSIGVLTSDFVAISELVERLSASQLRAETARTQDAFETANERFYQLRQEQNSVNESLKRQQNLRRQISELSARADDLLNLRKAVDDLLRQRQTARTQIKQIDDRIFELRLREVEAINSEHSETVHLALEAGSAPPIYVQLLSSLLTGSRIRAQEDVAREIAGAFTPAQLVDLVEASEAATLSGVLDRDLGQMNRVVTHLADHSDLYSLETLPNQPHLEITFFDDGQPKSVETLSKGQRATALLPLILRPLPYPLLIDQPEDDLDNHFIYSSLVQTIRKLKHHRQLIFVTHNANIPVLGDADQVVVMSMNSPVQAAPPFIGSVETTKKEILNLLEGGAEAFLLRERQYHDVLGLEEDHDDR